MNTRRNFLVMAMAAMVGGACTAATPSASTERSEPQASGALASGATALGAAEVPYTGPLPTDAIEAFANNPWPCPSCMYRSNGKIQGTLQTSTGFGSAHFPIQWMKAIYKDGGVVQSTEWIDIDDGVVNTAISHPVGELYFDEILIQWKDAENVIDVTIEGIPFEE